MNTLNVVVFVFVVVFCHIVFLIRRYRKFNYWENKNKGHIKKLKILLEDVYPVLEKRFHIFLIGGTLLGSVRNKKIIPWDDDIDLGIYTNNTENTIEELIKSEEFLLEKYKIKKTYFGARITDTENKSFIDIFLYIKQDDYIVCMSEKCRRKWPENKFTEDQMSLTKTIIYDKEYNSPSNSQDFLQRHFGEDYMTPKISHNHVLMIEGITVKNILTVVTLYIMRLLKINKLS